MVTFAVTLSDLIEKGGAYAGLAAFFGLAVLAVLYFAQARELKRLREWAGRAPERAQELEQAVVDRAAQQRRPAAAVQAQPRQVANPVSKPATAAASAAPPSAVASTPAADTPTDADAAETPDTAVTPATASTTPTEEGSPAEHQVGDPISDQVTDHEVVVKKVKAETDAADAEEDAADEESAVTAGATGGAAQATATAASPPTTSAPPQTGTTNGSGEIPALPARATPTPPPRRSAPAPAPYRPDRPLPPRSPLTSHLGEEPQRRNGAVIAGAGAGVILLVVAIIAILGGGGNDGSGNSTSTQTQAGTQPGQTVVPTTVPGKRPTARPTGGPSRPATKIEVLNGTTVAGLAGTVDQKLQQSGWASAGTGNFYEQTRSATIVFYTTSVYRTQAQAVAKLLGVDDVQLVDANTRRLAPDANVVVVVGSDQSA